MTRTALARWMCALAFASTPAVAQQIPVEDFAKYPEIDEVALSPTGEYLAMAVPTTNGKETNLQILRLADGSIIKTLRFGLEQHVVNVTWTADDQITVARARRFPMEEFPRSMGQVMSTNLTGDRQRLLFAYLLDAGTLSGRKKDLGWAFIQRAVDREPGKALVKFYCFPSDCGEDGDTVVYKVDTITGERKEVERIKDGEADSALVYDHDGVARVAYTESESSAPLMKYRPTPTSPWTDLPKTIAGHSLEGGVFAQDNNTLYARVSDKGEATQLYKIDLAKGTREKVIGRDDIEVGTILTGGRQSIPFGVMYTTHKPSVQYFDNTSKWAQLHAGLMKRFPGKLVSFLTFTRDDSKLLFYAYADRSPGNYYVIDLANGNKITQVGSRKQWFEGKPMAAMRPIEFKTRDGATVYGFYTAPTTGGAGPRPLVVMAHGGPFGVSDSWAFNPEVQFLANRGYGVLQVNYRGSGGRGDVFETQAWRQWGGMIQNDITDGVKYAIDNKLADPGRICLYGASYGGYTALMQPILNPGMYKCAIGYVGVYDLTLLNRDAELENDDTERWIARTMGNDDATLSGISPARRASDIKVPVMLVHGKADDTARLNQFRVMDSALRDIGRPAETFLAAGEGHGFAKPENIAELYRRIEKFLDQHIGTGASTTAATQ